VGQAMGTKPGALELLTDVISPQPLRLLVNLDSNILNFYGSFEFYHLVTSMHNYAYATCHQLYIWQSLPITLSALIPFHLLIGSVYLMFYHLLISYSAISYHHFSFRFYTVIIEVE
jgi:hypothetical protein